MLAAMTVYDLCITCDDCYDYVLFDERFNGVYDYVYVDMAFRVLWLYMVVAVDLYVVLCWLNYDDVFVVEVF